MTYDGANVRLYADGVLVGAPQARSLTTSTGTYYVGGIPAYATSFLNGAVDESRVLNRALSADEIADGYLELIVGPSHD